MHVSNGRQGRNARGVFRSIGAMQSAIRTFSVLAVLIGVGTACQTTPRMPGRDVQVTDQGRLVELNPSDIAVLPIEVVGTSIAPPVETLRRSAMKGLVRRRYSPLSAGMVDEQLLPTEGADGPVEASYAPGDLEEDAVLKITIDEWDTKHWDIRRAIAVGLTARMIDPRDPLGPDLWTARIDREFRFSTDGAVPTASTRALERACDEIFSEVFSRLPARDTSTLNELPAESDD